jgi:hypothetical protein
MKKTLMILGAILLAVPVAAGSFWGGMAYQTNRANQTRANFENARGLANTGKFPGNAEGFPRGGGTTGVVKTIDGNVMTVSTAQDVTTVNLSQTTQVEKSESAAISDLQPGMQVTVIGQSDSDGEITASQVTVLNNNSSDTQALQQPPYPSPTEREP